MGGGKDQYTEKNKRVNKILKFTRNYPRTIVASAKKEIQRWKYDIEKKKKRKKKYEIKY